MAPTSTAALNGSQRRGALFPLWYETSTRAAICAGPWHRLVFALPNPYRFKTDSYMQIFIIKLEFLPQLFVVVVWNFELYMLPLGLLLLLVWNFLFCWGRDTPDMVSNGKRKSDISPSRFSNLHPRPALIPTAVHGGHVGMGG